MSRKHVLFKCMSQSPLTPAFEQQAELELAVRGIKSAKVETVFGLIDFPDLKLIISKSPVLQRQLSAQLPQQGCYGFLWSGEQLPDLRQVLSTSPFIESCFVFQRTTDPQPEIMDSGFAMIQRQTEVYNWRVFQIGSLSYTIQQLCRIREAVPNAIELDREFRRFRQTFVPIRTQLNITGPWPEPQQFQLNGVLNYLQAIRPGTVEIHNGALLQNTLSASAGGPVNFVNHPDVRSFPNRLHACLNEKPLPEIQTAINGLISGLRLLLLSNGGQQADLFMDHIEHAFLSYWENEKPRLQDAGLPIKMQKGFAAARFLIREKVVSESRPVLDFLSAALMRTVQKPGRKADGADFEARLQTALTELLSYVSMLDKIQPLLFAQQALWHYVRLPEKAEAPAAAIFIPLPPYPPKDRKKQEYLNTLFEYPLTDWPDEQEIWHNQIALQGPFYQTLGRYGQALFNHLYARELKQEAVRLFYAWMQLYDFLNERKDNAVEGFRIALIFPYILPYHQAGSKDCPLKHIIMEWIEETRAPYEAEQIFEWEERPEEAEISSMVILKRIQ